MRPQESRQIHSIATFGVQRQKVSGMLNTIGRTEFFLQLGEGHFLLLCREKSLYIFDLAFHAIVNDVKQVCAQNKPHARAKQDLRECEDSDIPECQTDADRESLHACTSERIM